MNATPAQNLGILLIDDDPGFHQKMAINFRANCVISHALPKGPDDIWASILEGLQEADNQPTNLSLILLDLDLEGDGDTQLGLELIPKLKQARPEIPIIVVTNDRDLRTVVVAMKKGASHFLHKGSFEDLDEWQKTFYEIVKPQVMAAENERLKQAVTHKETEKRAIINEQYPFIGQSPAIKEVKEYLLAAGQDPNITLLITGETGVGKEVAARFMHQHSARQQDPFVAVQLSTFPPSLIESALFGYRKGAFTDAKDEHRGVFQQADKGIIFLDEIGDIEADIQIKLLRFLQERVIRRVGTEKDIPLNIQVITATNKDLKTASKSGAFREDLYYRLNSLKVRIPPLRERIEDIPLIIQHYWKLDAYQAVKAAFEATTYESLLAYSWPGNIRELRNALESMRLKMRIKGLNRIDESCLPEDIRFATTVEGAKSAPEQALGSAILDSLSSDEKIAYLQLQDIDQALNRTYGQKTAAGNLLSLDLDQMAYRVKKYARKHPDLLQHFTHIREYYPKAIKP